MPTARSSRLGNPHRLPGDGPRPLTLGSIVRTLNGKAFRGCSRFDLVLANHRCPFAPGLRGRALPPHCSSELSSTRTGFVTSKTSLSGDGPNDAQVTTPV